MISVSVVTSRWTRPDANRFHEFIGGTRVLHTRCCTGRGGSPNHSSPSIDERPFECARTPGTVGVSPES